jgi:triosephosphate isomerase
MGYGTGETASPEQAQEMHKFIRNSSYGIRKRYHEVSILYGGSVKPENKKKFF